MNDDKNISATWAVSAGAMSAAAWGTGFVLVILDMVIVMVDTGDLGILTAGVGGMLNVRAWLSAMQAREVEAFNIGREYETTLRSL